MPYNLVLVIADALRRDTVGAFNPGYRFTPGLDARMAGWYHFAHCYSSAPWTLPSVSTILTGIGADRHGEFFHSDPVRAPSIAELLPGDYRKTGTVNNGNLKESRGFARGFDDYTYTPDRDEVFELAQKAIVDARGGPPHFLLLHSNLPHDYYQVATKPYYAECFPDRRDWFKLQPKVISWPGLTPLERRRIRSFYDTCVLRLDQGLSAVLDTIDLTNTVVCVVADHGEGLDHDLGRIHHGGRVHDDLINVPLSIHLPDDASPELHERLRQRTGTAVSTADILPTLLDLVGEAPPAGIDGRSMVSAPPEDRIIVSEDRRFLYLRTRGRLNVNIAGKHTTRAMRLRNQVLQRTAGRHHGLKAFVRFPHKLIVTSVVPPAAMSSALGPVMSALLPDRAHLARDGAAWLALELFDLDGDPAELHNLLDGRGPDEVADLLAARFGDLDALHVVLEGRPRSLGAVLARRSPATRRV